MKILKEIKEIVIILAVIIFFRSSFLNWYVIPSGSMLPTLKIGDHVVVNKLSYGFMLPFTEKQIISWSEPKRGDIVVFQGPEAEGGQVLIKRIVGLPGDQVSFTDGVLTVNGVVAKETEDKDRSILKDLGGHESADDFTLYTESGFSNAPHYIMRKRFGSTTANQTQTWVVPPGKVLCVGDNRDNSYDGRFWGFIDEKALYGRAFMISYSTGDQGSWPHLRNERWFMKLTN